jgi:hypothetical protein
MMQTLATSPESMKNEVRGQIKTRGKQKSWPDPGVANPIEGHLALAGGFVRQLACLELSRDAGRDRAAAVAASELCR